MFDPQKAAAENQRINELLKQEPEYELIKQAVEFIRHSEEEIGTYKESIKEAQGRIDDVKQHIKDALIALEEKTGFSKAPNLAHLMSVSENYSVTNMDAVPQEFVITEITSKLDKRKLTAAIKSGIVDKNSNWLSVVPSYKTVCIDG